MRFRTAPHPHRRRALAAWWIALLVCVAGLGILVAASWLALLADDRGWKPELCPMGRRSAGVAQKSGRRPGTPGRDSRDESSGLPRVVAAEPSPVRLARPGRATVLLSGLRLTDVTHITVVSHLGAPVSDLAAQILARGTGAAASLLLEVSAGAGAPPADYFFQLNTDQGGVYAPQDVAKIVVSDPS